MKISGEPETDEELLDLLGEAFSKKDLARWRLANQLDAAADELESTFKKNQRLEEKVRDLTRLRDENRDRIWQLQNQLLVQAATIVALKAQINAQEAKIKELEW